jgi:hypothetical protein
MVGAVRYWLQKRAPRGEVFDEFVTHATDLYLSTTRHHPLGRRFHHAGQPAAESLPCPEHVTKSEQLLFIRRGRSGECDWCITERSIHTCTESVSLHEVTGFHPGFRAVWVLRGNIVLLKLRVSWRWEIPLSRFLTAAVAGTPVSATELRPRFTIPGLPSLYPPEEPEYHTTELEEI